MHKYKDDRFVSKIYGMNELNDAVRNRDVLYHAG